MKAPDEFPEIFLYRQFVDMRKHANGLATIVEQEMELSPFSDALFVFTNKHREIVRAVYWDKTGFAVWSKKLEKAKYHWPKFGACIVSLSVSHFKWLLDGFDLSKLKPHEPLDPTTIS